VIILTFPPSSNHPAPIPPAISHSNNFLLARKYSPPKKSKLSRENGILKLAKQKKKKRKKKKHLKVFIPVTKHFLPILTFALDPDIQTK